MRTSEVLNTAADLIEQRGWTKGVSGWSRDPGGALCLEGAIYAATGSQDFLESETANTCPAGQAVRSHLEMSAYDMATPLYDFNDASRTASEVIEVLRACALIEASREEQDAAWETYAESVSA